MVPVDPHRGVLVTSRAGLADPGRQRRLARLTGTGNVVTGLALDLDRPLRVAVTEPAGEPPTALLVRRFGTELARALAGLASLVQLDEPCGGEAIRTGAIPPQVAITMPLIPAAQLEADGEPRPGILVSDEPSAPDMVARGELLDAVAFSPQRALWWGADACHLAIAERPAGADSAMAWDDLMAAAVSACHTAGVPLIVEPIVALSPDESATSFAAEAASRIVAATLRLRPHGPDLIAIRLPSARAAAIRGEAASREQALWQGIDRACGTVPWVLVDPGPQAGPFEDQIRAAGAAGASGFIAGPSVWASALTLGTGERRRAIESTAVPSFTRFVEAAWTSCHPLAERPAIREPHRHPLQARPAR